MDNKKEITTEAIFYFSGFWFIILALILLETQKEVTLLLALCGVISIVAGIISSIASDILDFKCQLNSLQLQIFRLNNTKTRALYIEEMLKCNYKYSLRLKKTEGSSDNEASEFSEFSLIDSKYTFRELANEEDVVGLCFYNFAENAGLYIDSIVSNSDNCESIKDESMLSALMCNSSVCILCKVNELTKEFIGKFHGIEIAFNSFRPETSAVNARHKRR